MKLRFKVNAIHRDGNTAEILINEEDLYAVFDRRPSIVSKYLRLRNEQSNNNH